jgi:hypothetical protein
MSTMYKILPKIFLSRLTPYTEVIIENHQCGFRSNTSVTNHIFYMRHILQENWEYIEEVHQLFINFKKA